VRRPVAAGEHAGRVAGSQVVLLRDRAAATTQQQLVAGAATAVAAITVDERQSNPVRTRHHECDEHHQCNHELEHSVHRSIAG